eukprot:TRINITY_DN8233_c0_g1_i1.p1 TRINITY_DN8233_c0_g1~~TRINITY_DN8233_c0_g1_i1.p1  ORF type:complete len:1150 (+),score=297.05 TRINITY_DN8233_c0_g1_i1:369-3818(+)
MPVGSARAARPDGTPAHSRSASNGLTEMGDGDGPSDAGTCSPVPPPGGGGAMGVGRRSSSSSSDIDRLLSMRRKKRSRHGATPPTRPKQNADAAALSAKKKRSPKHRARTPPRGAPLPSAVLRAPNDHLQPPKATTAWTPSRAVLADADDDLLLPSPEVPEGSATAEPPPPAPPGVELINAAARPWRRKFGGRADPSNVPPPPSSDDAGEHAPAAADASEPGDDDEDDDDDDDKKDATDTSSSTLGGAWAGRAYSLANASPTPAIRTATPLDEDEAVATTSRSGTPVGDEDDTDAAAPSLGRSSPQPFARKFGLNRVVDPSDIPPATTDEESGTDRRVVGDSEDGKALHRASPQPFARKFGLNRVVDPSDIPPPDTSESDSDAARRSAACLHRASPKPWARKTNTLRPVDPSDIPPPDSTSDDTASEAVAGLRRRSPAPFGRRGDRGPVDPSDIPPATTDEESGADRGAGEVDGILAQFSSSEYHRDQQTQHNVAPQALRRTSPQPFARKLGLDRPVDPSDVPPDTTSSEGENARAAKPDPGVVLTTPKPFWRRPANAGPVDPSCIPPRDGDTDDTGQPASTDAGSSKPDWKPNLSVAFSMPAVASTVCSGRRLSAYSDTDSDREDGSVYMLSTKKKKKSSVKPGKHPRAAAELATTSAPTSIARSPAVMPHPLTEIDCASMSGADFEGDDRTEAATPTFLGTAIGGGYSRSLGGTEFPTAASMTETSMSRKAYGPATTMGALSTVWDEGASYMQKPGAAKSPDTLAADTPQTSRAREMLLSGKLSPMCPPAHGAGAPPLSSALGSGLSTQRATLESFARKLKRLVQEHADAVCFELTDDECVGGTYFLLHRNTRIAVFKPADQEAGLPANPKAQVAVAAGEESKAGFFPGMGYLREVAAYVLDHDGFAGVPITAVLELDLSTVRVKGPDGRPRAVRRNPGARRLCVGSVQKFLLSECQAWDTGPGQFSPAAVRRIAILDLRILNCDRHGGNILVQAAKARKQKKNLVPIDHGYVLPSTTIKELDFEWLQWSQAKTAFAPDELDYIRNLDPDVDADLLRSLGIDDGAVENMVVATVALQIGALEFDMTAAQLGDFYRRATIDGTPSELETLVAASRGASPADGSSAPVDLQVFRSKMVAHLTEKKGGNA